MTTHDMFDGRLQLYKRGSGRFWQCAARIGDCRFRTTTREDRLDRTKDAAEEWRLGLRGQLRNGEIVKKEAARFQGPIRGHARFRAAHGQHRPSPR